MRIIVIGCGRVGAGLARGLGLRGHSLTMVDSDPSAFERLGRSFSGDKVVGIGFDRDVLIQAGIERADGLAAVTASDEANIVTARVASQVFHVPRVVARLYDPGKAEIYRRLGLQTISPVTWGVNRIAELLTYSGLGTTTSLGSGQVDLVEVETPPLLVGRTVNDITVPGEVVVAAITRDVRTMIPSLGAKLQEGDTLHIVVRATSAARLEQMLGLA